MSSIVNEKNPISILNELASKENSKIVYEFISTQEGFLAKVHYNSSQIGEGQDKKKQKAKSKAAESALSYLNSLKFIENPEMELQTLSKLLKKTGKFTLISKEPFIYEYYLDSMLISSSSSLITATSGDPYSTYHRTNSANSLLDHHHHHHHHQPQQQQPHHLQPHLKINEIEFQEALEKNRIISGSAISRAVQDATIGLFLFISKRFSYLFLFILKIYLPKGQYQSALDTLQTAISLIKQTK